MYTIFRLYDDLGTMTETASSISDAFSAASIYLEDKSCIGIKIWNTENGEIITDFTRP